MALVLTYLFYIDCNTNSDNLRFSKLDEFITAYWVSYQYSRSVGVNIVREAAIPSDPVSCALLLDLSVPRISLSICVAFRSITL